MYVCACTSTYRIYIYIYVLHIEASSPIAQSCFSFLFHGVPDQGDPSGSIEFLYISVMFFLGQLRAIEAKGAAHLDLMKISCARNKQRNKKNTSGKRPLPWGTCSDLASLKLALFGLDLGEKE